MMQEPEYISSLNHEQYQEHLYRDALLGLAEGVAFIHREDHNGQVGYHRDLKPKNILLLRWSRPSLENLRFWLRKPQIHR